MVNFLPFWIPWQLLVTRDDNGAVTSVSKAHKLCKAALLDGNQVLTPLNSKIEVVCSQCIQLCVTDCRKVGLQGAICR
jgi:hypothetical protein